MLDRIKIKSNFVLNPKEDVAQGIVTPQDYVNKKSSEILKNTFKVGTGIFILSKDEVDALKLLQDNGYQYVLTLYDKSPEALNFIKYTMDHPTVPIIYEYRKDKSIRKIGGYTELKKELDSLHEQE